MTHTLGIYFSEREVEEALERIVRDKFNALFPDWPIEQTRMGITYGEGRDDFNMCVTIEQKETSE